MSVCTLEVLAVSGSSGGRSSSIFIPTVATTSCLGSC